MYEVIVSTRSTGRVERSRFPGRDEARAAADAAAERGMRECRVEMRFVGDDRAEGRGRLSSGD